MRQADLEAFVADLANVQRVANEDLGYTFFFVGDDHRLPFVSIAYSDNEHDDVSNLDRDGVFRVNIGVSRETFDNLLDHSDSASADIDYSALNIFLPHPHYSRQNFVCILNPGDDNVEETKRLIAEAHSIAEARAQRKAKG